MDTKALSNFYNVFVAEAVTQHHLRGKKKSDHPVPGDKDNNNGGGREFNYRRIGPLID